LVEGFAQRLAGRVVNVVPGNLGVLTVIEPAAAQFLRSVERKTLKVPVSANSFEGEIRHRQFFAESDDGNSVTWTRVPQVGQGWNQKGEFRGQRILVIRYSTRPACQMRRLEGSVKLTIDCFRRRDCQAAEPGGESQIGQCISADIQPV